MHMYNSLSANLRLWGSWRWHQRRESSTFSSMWLWGQTTTRCSMATFWPSDTNNNHFPTQISINIVVAVVQEDF